MGHLHNGSTGPIVHIRWLDPHVRMGEVGPISQICQQVNIRDLLSIGPTN